MKTSVPRMFSSIWNETSRVRKPMQPRRARAECPSARQSPAPARDARFPRTASADRESCWRRRRASRMPAHPSGSGWGGRIRTFEYGIQSPAPYRLATPQLSTAGEVATAPVAPARDSSVGLTGPSQTRKSITGPRAGRPRAGRASGSGSTSQSGRCSRRAARGPRPPENSAENRRSAARHGRRRARPRAGRPRPSRRSPGAGAPREPARSLHERDRPARPADVDRRRRRRSASAAPRGAVLIQPAVRVGRRHAERRLDDDDAEPRDVVDRVQLVAAPDAERRAAEEEERHVGPELGAEPRPDRAATRRASQSVFSPTSAAAASALPPPRPAAAGICFLEPHVHVARLARAAERAPQQLGRAPDEVRRDRPARPAPRRDEAERPAPRVRSSACRRARSTAAACARRESRRRGRARRAASG